MISSGDAPRTSLRLISRGSAPRSSLLMIAGGGAPPWASMERQGDVTLGTTVPLVLEQTSFSIRVLFSIKVCNIGFFSRAGSTTMLKPPRSECSSLPAYSLPRPLSHLSPLYNPSMSFLPHPFSLLLDLT